MEKRAGFKCGRVTLPGVEGSIKGIRKAMMAQMNAANAIPHFSYCDECVMDELIATRAVLKPLAEKYGQQGNGLTFS